LLSNANNGQKSLKLPIPKEARQFTDGSASTQTGEECSRRFFACHGCGGPHPWTEFKNGEHIVVCPNHDNPGIRENAKKNIERMKANRQKRAKQNTKRKNLGTANFANFDTAEKIASGSKSFLP
jgi:hypothetical protein